MFDRCAFSFGPLAGCSSKKEKTWELRHFKNFREDDETLSQLQGCNQRCGLFSQLKIDQLLGYKLSENGEKWQSVPKPTLVVNLLLHREYRGVCNKELHKCDLSQMPLTLQLSSSILLTFHLDKYCCQKVYPKFSMVIKK